ncbi:hypothetical protein QTN93_00990 [Sphingomonas aerolata]|uniref:hypothetical protein n=1 Tax=Sphingomonas aerolata TaxID=185951 RepID=UPI0035A62A7B
MIDMPDTPPAYDKILTQRLMRCGLHQSGLAVQYQQELQSIEIFIGQDAHATADHFDCINDAAGYEVVTFENSEMQLAYEDRVVEIRKPKILANARAALESRGVLEGFPGRSEFSTDKLFAEALERQCGMEPGSFFVQTQSGMIGQPQTGRKSKADEARANCLIAAIMYVSAKGELSKFGFDGNEAIAPER